MPIKLKTRTVKDQLSKLADLLEKGDDIPNDLARECAAYVRDGLANKGKLPLCNPTGRPATTWMLLYRAIRVAELKLGGTRVPNACEFVAEQDGVSKWAVEQNYKKFGKSARQIARFNRDFPAWLDTLETLRAMLRTFCNDDMRSFDDNDVDEVLRDLPASKLHIYVNRIHYGPLRRDRKFLQKVLS